MAPGLSLLEAPAGALSGEGGATTRVSPALACSLPSRCRRTIPAGAHSTFLIVVVALLHAVHCPWSGTARAGERLYEAVGRGFYDVRAPAGAMAWLLPPTGTEDECRPGDARDVQWSADAQRIAVTVDDGMSLTLCMYQLKSSWLTRATRRVRVERPRAMMFEGGASASDTVRAFERAMGPGQRRAYTEHEAAWVPEILDPGNVSSYPAVIAFSNGREGHPTRTFGLKGIDFGPRCTSIPLDGQSRFETRSTRAFYQPAWVPDISGGRARGLGLAEVTQRDVPCGTERIVYLATPVCERPEDCNPPLVELANACAAASSRGAVRFPSWAPVAANDRGYRLAFVRIAPAKNQAVCVRTGPLSSDKAEEICYDDTESGRAISRVYPAWSRDGRYLAYFEVKPDAREGALEPAKAGNVARIKVIDMSASGRAGPRAVVPTVLIEGVRPNPEHGPTMVTLDGRTWVFAITTEDGVRYDRITAVTAGPETVERIVFDPGLQNLKAIDVASYRRGGPGEELRLGIVAQGYRNMIGADQSRDKVFIHVIPLDRLK